jgi:hypothetical protein
VRAAAGAAHRRLTLRLSKGGEALQELVVEVLHREVIPRAPRGRQRARRAAAVPPYPSATSFSQASLIGPERAKGASSTRCPPGALPHSRTSAHMVNGSCA